MAKSTQDVLRHGEDLGHTPAITKKQMTDRIELTITVTGCARCGETHEIEFFPFAKNPIDLDGEISSHWGMCPNLNEPVLMRMEERTGAAPMGQPSKTLGDY